MADESASSASIGIGEALKNRRRQKNYTLEMIAQETRISVRFLRALEEEKWTEFPAKVYLEGFLRHYGNFLGMDGEDFVKKWREAQARSEKPALTRVSSTHSVQSEEEAASKSGFRPELVFLGALVVFLGALYFVTARLERSRSARGPEAAPAAAPAEGQPAVPQHASELKVYAKRAVWLRVWADRRVRFEGILPQEGRKSWTGQSVFRIQSANTSLLDVTVNDVPLSPSAEKSDEFVWVSTAAAPADAAPHADAGNAAPAPTEVLRRAPAPAQEGFQLHSSTQAARRRRPAPDAPTPAPPVP